MSSGKTYLLFGGGGFIGSHLAECLLEDGCCVKIFDKINFKRSNISHIEHQIEVIEGDFNNRVEVRQALKAVDIVVHLVSSTIPSVSMDNIQYDIETNLVASVNLLQECVKNGTINKVAFISSGGTVYGEPQSIPIPVGHPLNPISSYGIIKSAIEYYFLLFQRTYGLSCNILRFSNPYGERQNPNGQQGVVPIFLRKILNDEKISIWGDGEIIRDYIYIKDAVRAVANAVSTDDSSAIYNIGSGTGLSLNELLQAMQDVCHKTAQIEYIERRAFDVPRNILDISVTREKLNWAPQININEGLELMRNYLSESSQDISA